METNKNIPIEDIQSAMYNYYANMLAGNGSPVDEKKINEIVDKELADYLGCVKNIEFWNSRVK